MKATAVDYRKKMWDWDSSVRHSSVIQKCISVCVYTHVYILYIKHAEKLRQNYVVSIVDVYSFSLNICLYFQKVFSLVVSSLDCRNIFNKGLI